MGARHSVARCPRWWSGAEDRSEPIRQWVSEDRRPGVPTKSGWVGVRISWGGRCRAARWGAWAPTIRWALFPQPPGKVARPACYNLPVESTLIAVGDELLGGFTLDTNSNWLAQQLNRLGFPVKRITVIPDRLDEIVE